MSIESRLGKLESAIGPVAEPDPYEGRDQSVINEIAGAALQAAEAAHDASPRPITPESQARCQAVAIEAADALVKRLDAEGIGHAPLDEAGKARVRDLAAELANG